MASIEIKPDPNDKTAKHRSTRTKAAEVILASEVANAYFQMLRSAKMYEYTAKYFVQLEELHVLKKSLYENGLEDLLELDRTMSQARISQNQYKEERDIAAHELSTLTGAEPRTFGQLPHYALEQITLPPQIKTGIPLAVISQRPDIRAQEERLLKAKIDVRVAKKNFLPTVKATDYFGFIGSRFGRLTGDSFFNLLLGNINQPIFQGGRLLADLRLQQSKLKEQIETYRQKILTALKEVEDSLSGLQRHYDDMDSNARELKASVQQAQLIQSRYQTGLSSGIDVINAENEVLYTRRQ